MRSHLLKIKQNVVKRAAAHALYKSTIEQLDKEDAMSLMGLKAAGVSNASVAGYIGAASKAIINSRTAHSGLDKATDMHCAVMAKIVDGVAGQLHIDVRDRSNANSDEAGGASTHSGEDMEGSPVVHSLKGLSAAELQKASTVLPGSTPLTTPLGHALQKRLGRNNPNESFGYGFDKGVHVEHAPQGGQTRVLSEYEKRHQK